MNIDRPYDTSRRRFLQVSGAVCLAFVGGAIADANTLLNNRSTNGGMITPSFRSVSTGTIPRPGCPVSFDSSPGFKE